MFIQNPGNRGLSNHICSNFKTILSPLFLHENLKKKHGEIPGTLERDDTTAFYLNGKLLRIGRLYSDRYLVVLAWFISPKMPMRRIIVKSWRK